VVLGRLGRGEEAWKTAQAAVRAERRPGRAQANLCALAVTRERVASGQAVTECARAVGANPGLLEPLVNLARSQARAGLATDAASTFRRAEERFGLAPFLLGHRVAFHLSEGRLEQALADQRSLVSEAPNDPGHRRNLVAVLAQVGQARRSSGDQKGACSAADEMRRAAPGVAPVAQRADTLCPASGDGP
ncbi:MAG: hypothetical protein VX938_05260, partial [Myxococcota bacterium]|nr:hypothetical protein [Myxococcota bacterium]